MIIPLKPEFLLNDTLYKKSRDSAFYIAFGYGLDDQGVGVPSPGGDKNVHFFMLSRSALGPSNFLSNG
jgi:hypothetical protein